MVHSNSLMGPPVKAVLLIHGGAGVIDLGKISAEREAGSWSALEAALQAGYGLLQKGRSSLDAVEAAVCVLEDSPLFNAGHGAVLNREGKHELDASVMDGKQRAGGVTCVTRIRNPIRAARKVMEESGHVLLAGEAADRFAEGLGMEVVDPTYYCTEERWQPGLASEHGTVGAVALDQAGELAAGTSTGGLVGKRAGRVGDSPIIGAGTYADNATCAVSCTGDGDTMMRYVVAYDVAARMKYRRCTVHEAAEHAFLMLPSMPGGVGGLIALDRRGNFAMPFNTQGMYRGFITTEGKSEVAVYGSGPRRGLT